jgi:putative protease
MAEKTETKEKKAPKEKKVGEIAHYFGKIMVAAIKVKAEIKVGDTLHIKGHTTDFEQVVDSMQMEHQSVPNAKKGDDIGIKVKDHVREGDEVFLK